MEMGYDGIDQERARHLFAAGLGSVAMITAITQVADYRAATWGVLKLDKTAQ
ncbi:MAG: hypothetical protein KDI44_11315 [Thiothrix sp.]|nr:hypothetical protein [Thiothrix sp.]HPQ94090.1 hypothetical protein [Thiolinea sp.]